MERVPKSPVTLRCRMERGDVLPAGLFVRRLFEFYDWFYFRVSQLIFSDALITPRVQCRWRCNLADYWTYYAKVLFDSRAVFAALRTRSSRKGVCISMC
ncbi:hypothetical protein TNCV_5089771 [Trichonephila clavipes]|nr:hypothetical protein TNCV_5089771 [Trichonephila clavipes]